MKSEGIPLTTCRTIGVFDGVSMGEDPRLDRGKFEGLQFMV